MLAISESVITSDEYNLSVGAKFEGIVQRIHPSKEGGLYASILVTSPPFLEGETRFIMTRYLDKAPNIVNLIRSE